MNMCISIRARITVFMDCTGSLRTRILCLLLVHLHVWCTVVIGAFRLIGVMASEIRRGDQQHYNRILPAMPNRIPARLGSFRTWLTSIHVLGLISHIMLL